MGGSKDGEAQLSKIILENYAKLEAYAVTIFNNPDIAEDVVQETFLIAQVKLEDLLQSSNPGGWLMRTLKNVIGDTLRKRKQLMDIYSPVDVSKVPVEFKLHPRLKYEGIIGEDELNLLLEVYCDGNTYEEAAKTRNISLDACKKRIQRAKIKFKKASETDM